MICYIDPGTGSMLFTILIGLIGTGFYALRMFVIKMKFKISGGKSGYNDEKIPFAIFSDDKRYWKIFEPICKEFEKREKEIVYMTASKDDPALNNDFKYVKTTFIGDGNKAFSKLNFLRASILLSTTPGLEVYQWKRSKEVDYYVHIPHAASEITLYRMFGIDYYDSILLSGEYQANDIRNLEKLRNLPAKELEYVGIPYMDEMLKRVKETPIQTNKKKTVLLAPSWGPSAILSVYGEKIIDAILNTGYQLIVRPHPQSFKSETEMIERLMSKYPNSDKIQWNRDTDNFDVLSKSDILISDFSGVVFDFTLIFDKPIIYTNPDFDISLYDAWWLDTPLWTKSALPRLGMQLTSDNFDDLSHLIDSCLSDPKFKVGRDEVRSETWKFVGQGAVKTADYLIAKYEEIKKSKEVK